jgi:ABC-2 type transport system permease protein
MQLRTHVIWAVFQRNFRSYFAGPLGYLFIVVFVALGSFLAFNDDFFASNLASLAQLNKLFPVLLVLFVPAITMAAWSEERRNGTDELLFTLPATDFEIVLGKYLAVLGVYTVALLFSLSHVVVLQFLGGFDLGQIVATYIGYWVTGAALLACGMVASVLTNSVTVGYILGALLCAIPVFIDTLRPSSRLLQGLSVQSQFRDFGMGMLPLGGLLFFLSLTVFMLYLNLVLVSRRHWKGGPHGTAMGLHYLVRALALGVALVGLNVLASRATRRLDLTSEQLFSVSPATRAVLESIPADRPVQIEAFLSPEVPRELAQTRTSLVGMLRQLDVLGGDKLRVRIVSTEKFSDAADEAKNYGIEVQEVPTLVGGKYTRDDVYMGFVVKGSVDDEVIVPFLDKGTPVEDELTRAIRTVSAGSRKKVGVLKTDAQLMGGFDMQAFRSLPEWRIAQDLKKQYEVLTVSPEELATRTDLDVLLAVMPSSLGDPELDSLIKYVQDGYPTLIIDDPLPFFQPSLAPSQPKPRPGGNNPFGGGPPPQPKGDIGRLASALEIAWDPKIAVWDRYVAHPELREFFELNQLYSVVSVTPANRASFAFSKDSPATRSLQEMLLFYPGELRPTEGMTLKFVPLLRSSPASRTYRWEEFVQSGFMGMMGLINPPEKKSDKSLNSLVLAAQVTGDSKTNPGRKINVIFAADMDMLMDQFYLIRDREYQDLKLDNIAFVMNAIDDLAGDQAFIELRSRRPQHRTLTLVEERVKESREKEAAAAEEAETKAKKDLEEASAGLQKAIDAIEERTDLDPRQKQTMKRIAEENKTREYEVQKAQIENDKNKQIKALKNSTERDVNRITGFLRSLALLLPPIPALLLGLFVYVRRSLDERQGLNPDRIVDSK